LKRLSIFVLAVAMGGGCASRVHRAPKHGFPAPIPDCDGAYIWVPEDCHLSPFADHVEVQCPKSTTKFSRCAKP
jgi:hypothetical protein